MFSPDGTLTESHLELLAEFPNLELVHIPNNIQPEWLGHLKDCESLRIVSLNESNATDGVIPYLLEIPRIREIFTRETQISDQGIKNFVHYGSEKNRYANGIIPR